MPIFTHAELCKLS